MQHLKEFKPWFIEEPTSPDDVLGHKAIRGALKPDNIGVATGEMAASRPVITVFSRDILLTLRTESCSNNS
jgi:L-galactonate dehydratase